MVNGGGGGGAGGNGWGVPDSNATNGATGGTGTGGSVAITWTSTPNTTFTKAVTISGNLNVTGNISKSSGSFAIDHPLDPAGKLLYHSFVESPYAMNMYDGVANLNARGEATVALPEYFDALNKDVRYQLKPIGAPMPALFVKEEEHDNHFVIGGGTPNGRASWQITGVRHDPFILAHPIVPEVEKGPNELVDKGEYLFPDAFKRSFSFPFFGDFFSSIARALGIGTFQ